GVLANIHRIVLTRLDPPPYEGTEADENDDEDEESDYNPANESSRCTPEPRKVTRRETRTSIEANANTTKATVTPSSIRRGRNGMGVGRITPRKSVGGCRPHVKFNHRGADEDSRRSSESELSPPPEELGTEIHVQTPVQAPVQALSQAPAQEIQGI